MVLSAAVVDSAVAKGASLCTLGHLGYPPELCMQHQHGHGFGASGL